MYGVHAHVQCACCDTDGISLGSREMRLPSFLGTSRKPVARNRSLSIGTSLYYPVPLCPTARQRYLHRDLAACRRRPSPMLSGFSRPCCRRACVNAPVWMQDALHVWRAGHCLVSPFTRRAPRFSAVHVWRAGHCLVSPFTRRAPRFSAVHVWRAGSCLLCMRGMRGLHAWCPISSPTSSPPSCARDRSTLIRRRTVSGCPPPTVTGSAPGPTRMVYPSMHSSIGSVSARRRSSFSARIASDTPAHACARLLTPAVWFGEG
jgi:hypothetical protein